MGIFCLSLHSSCCGIQLYVTEQFFSKVFLPQRITWLRSPSCQQIPELSVGCNVSCKWTTMPAQPLLLLRHQTHVLVEGNVLPQFETQAQMIDYKWLVPAPKSILVSTGFFSIIKSPSPETKIS